MIWGFDWSHSGFIDGIGYFGAGVYLTAYSLLQTGVLRGRGYAYALMVIVAASCMIISTINAPNPAVVIMQACYILISVLGIARVFVNARMLRQTPEERDFISNHLPDLRREHVRSLLKRAEWKDVPAGVTLCKQDEKLDRFCFLSEGEAAVTIDDRFIGNSHDCFVGELSFMTDGPATATVVTTTPSRILVFERKDLEPLIKRQPEIKLALIAGFSNAAKSMLLRRNQEALSADARARAGAA